MSKLLEVGDKFYLRNDLRDRHKYGDDIFVHYMNPFVGKKLQVSSFSKHGSIQAQCGGWSITNEMIDWPKTVRINPRLQLKEGDKFYIRGDISEGEVFNGMTARKWMISEPNRPRFVTNRTDDVNVHGVFERELGFEGDYFYSLEMIDWIKTLTQLKEYEPVNTEEVTHDSGCVGDVSDINIDLPQYYNNGIETQKYVRSHGLNFNRGSAIKYATRAGNKDKDAEIQDLKKAINFLQFEIDALEQGEVYFASKREIN